VDESQRTKSGTLRAMGLGHVLDAARDDMAARVAKRLRERREHGWNDLSDSEIETLSRAFGNDARAVTADALTAHHEYQRRIEPIEPTG
jgi:hypothetical protein